MSWDEPGRSRGPRLAPPEDGIVASSRPRGWLGQRWEALLDAYPDKAQTRIARGRGHARNGRVRDLWFAPGAVGAEVWDTATHRVSVRVEVLPDEAWDRVIEALSQDLRHLAALLEGELPQAVLERSDVPLVPRLEEVGCDCDCGDWVIPCEHAAAVHHLLADALDGDPFLLPTLRGRDRNQVLARLRGRGGHPGGGESHTAGSEPVLLAADSGGLSAYSGAAGTLPATQEGSPLTGGWFDAPGGVPQLRFQVKRPATSALGLRALGAPPGGEELVKALAPLYESGAEAALQLALDDDAPAPKRRWRATLREQGMQEDGMSKVEQPRTGSLTEALVDTLAEMESAKSRELADRLGLSSVEVRNELLDLEKLGIVYRTGKTRGTRWWLG